MIYAISDLHGCYEKYEQMLELIRLSEKDTLYILGDIVDRGPDGIRILLDLMKRENAEPLRGNHDVLAMSLLKKLSEPSMRHSKKLLEVVGLWFQDGGEATYRAFAALDPKTRRKVLDYMDRFLVYEELTVNGREFSCPIPSREGTDAGLRFLQMGGFCPGRTGI